MHIRIGPITWGNWTCETIVRNADGLVVVSFLNNSGYAGQVKLFFVCSSC